MHQFPSTLFHGRHFNRTVIIIKQRICPMLGFKKFTHAAIAISGIELAQKIRKGQDDTSAVTVRAGARVPHM